ncbi:conserved hypothetical protein [Pediculus humanus corporis]|uniref:Dynein regulatory complex subunit 4 n=1 Tax=Pediculus humanus subsp. corporis TaxID=121224 RepID=E0VUI4_PEDHC|nr:uncharacterized protein Phum_PHUM450900 [Pediculus humanus corporis]EEB17040.1 conserved hypothetical protein [Pediculus humanus corporis]
MGPKKQKNPIIIDGVDTSVLSREKLEKFAIALKEALDKEREERNFFQIERDKIRTFWDITRQQLEECRTELLNKERQMEEKEDSHFNESKLFKQRVKYLIYEHHKNISELRAEGMLSLKLSQEDFEEQEKALLTDKKNLKEKLIEQQKQHQDVVRNLNMKFSEDLSNARNDFEEEVRELDFKYKEDLQSIREELALKHRMELTEAITENRELKRQLSNYGKDKVALIEALKRVNELEKELDDYKWENEALELRLSKTEEQKNEFQDSFFSSILTAQEQSATRNILLEKKMKNMLKLLEQRETQFSEFIKSHKIDHSRLGPVNIRIDKLLTKKNATIEDLEYELARVSKAHEDVLQTFQGKLEQYGIPTGELGFTPVRTAMLTSKAPAGLCLYVNLHTISVI